MVDTPRPLSLFLGAVCVWSVMLLILAMTGLGGRFTPAPADRTLVPSLPAVNLTPSPARLGSMNDYLEVGTRPLMMVDRRPAPVAATEDAKKDLDVTLTSVLITPRLKLAILTENKDSGVSHRVQVGNVVDGTNWRLIQLAPRQAVLEGPTGQRTLELRVFDGKSGAAPTPMSNPVANKEPLPPDVARDATLTPPVPAPLPPQAAPTQQQQIEAIRRRIEARRAQMRAEAERGRPDQK